MIRQKKIKTSESLAVLHNRSNTSALAIRTLGQGNQNIKGGRLNPNWEASCGFQFSLSLIQGKKISLIMVMKAFFLLYHGENESSGLMGYQWSPPRWVRQIEACASQTRICCPSRCSGLFVEKNDTMILDYQIDNLEHWRWGLWGKFCSHIPLNNHSRE